MLSLKLTTLCGRLLNHFTPTGYTPLLFSDKFDEGCWKLQFCPIFMWWTSEFNWILFLLLTKNNRSDSTYSDWTGRLCTVVNKHLHHSVLLHPLIILIISSALYKYLHYLKSSPKILIHTA